MRQGISGGSTNFLISLIALVAAIITGGIIVWLFGNNPIEAYKALIQAPSAPMAFTQSLTKSVHFCSQDLQWLWL